MKLKHEHGAYLHWCPGCKGLHLIPVDDPYDVRWLLSFGENGEPTFLPSVRHQTGAGGMYCCHYSIADGKIQFHSDSSHGLAGRTVDLPPLPPENE